MSRSCAKPICSDPAVSWFDLSRGTQQVTRSSVPTDAGIALCASHAERFSVPAGWALTITDDAPIAESEESASAPAVDADAHESAVDEVAEEETAGEAVAAEQTAGDEVYTESPVATADGVDTGTERHRTHDRDNPWFVAAPSDAEATPGHDSADEWSLGHPTEGSLLHRAFHGPTATDEGEQASDGDTVGRSAPVDELSPRRRARSSSDDAEEEAVAGYREFELPFPPHSPRSQRVAVS